MANDTADSTTRTTATSSTADSTRTGLAGITHAILRIGAGLLFMQHGAQKLFGWLGGDAVELVSLMGLAGVLEFFGGLLVVLGAFTMPVAGILTIEMIVAYFMAHAPQGGFPIQNDGELALLYALVFLFLTGNGAGPWSIDGPRRGNRWW